MTSRGQPSDSVALEQGFIHTPPARAKPGPDPVHLGQRRQVDFLAVAADMGPLAVLAPHQTAREDGLGADRADHVRWKGRGATRKDSFGILQRVTSRRDSCGTGSRSRRVPNGTAADPSVSRGGKVDTIIAPMSFGANLAPGQPTA